MWIHTMTAIQFILAAGVVVYLTLNMLHLVRVRPARGPLPSHPFVTVCVPARDEERDIRTCLTSLLAQDYPRFEVIAVDDNSTDATGEIIRSLAEKHSNLVFVEGSPLPPGWLGKPHALHQAQKRGRGDYLLFTDADVVFQPHALTSAVHAMVTRNLDMLSLMPAAVFGSFWERAVQPVVFGFIAALTRFEKINRPGDPAAMGFGAFLMFKKEVYEKMGGHEAVKGEILEDVMLARLAKRAGFRLLVADAKPLFSIRMYHSLGEIWTGWKKNLFIAMKKSIPRTLYHVGMILGFVLTPWLVVLANLWQGTGWFWSGLSLSALLLNLGAGTGLCDELKLRRANALLFPLGAVIMAAIMLNSMAQVLVRGQTEWRGRTYSQ
ncbi:MAG: glycosyltransferase [Nitrospinaceae bacterium]